MAAVLAALVILFVIWGLALPSNWTVGLIYGVGAAQSQGPTVIIAIAAVLTLGFLAMLFAEPSRAAVNAQRYYRTGKDI